MALKDKVKQKTISWDELDSLSSEKHFLVLHNDDINTFEHVIECLINICKHEMIQAEQCAYITHYKGKCEIKKGVLTNLRPLKDKLINKGLNVTID
jgi:ATP-dependent Clp protease adaptor protein ClpS